MNRNGSLPVQTKKRAAGFFMPCDTEYTKDQSEIEQHGMEHHKIKQQQSKGGIT